MYREVREGNRAWLWETVCGDSVAACRARSAQPTAVRPAGVLSGGAGPERGENAHSPYSTEDAFARAGEPKELHVVEGAGHVDLYHRVDLIPWDKFESFFAKHLA